MDPEARVVLKACVAFHLSDFLSPCDSPQNLQSQTFPTLSSAEEGFLLPKASRLGQLKESIHH